MRHSDYRTTQKHYTVLGLNDTSGAIEKIPWIRSAAASSATGTDGIAKSDRQQYRQQCARQNVQHAARSCKKQEEDRHGDLSRKSGSHKVFCENMPRDTMPCNDPAGVAQLVERQLPKLNVEGSSPFTRFIRISLHSVAPCRAEFTHRPIYDYGLMTVSCWGSSVKHSPVAPFALAVCWEGCLIALWACCHSTSTNGPDSCHGRVQTTAIIRS